VLKCLNGLLAVASNHRVEPCNGMYQYSSYSMQLSLDSWYPISQVDGDAIGQEWGPVAHVYQRYVLCGW
jgi:hypothetical protein